MVPGAFTLTWLRRAPMRALVRPVSARHWTVDIYDDSDVVDLDPPAQLLPSQPWLKAPHARLVAPAAPLEEAPLPPPPIEETVMAAAPAKKRTHDEALPLEEDAPAPKRQRATARDVAEALMPVQDIDALRERYTKGADKLHRRPQDDMVWLDTSPDPETGEKRHDYHLVRDGRDEIIKWLSVSKIKNKFYGAFDPVARAAKLELLTKRPAQTFLDEWALTGPAGTAKHRVYEAFLAWETPWPEGVAWPPPQGFLRCLAAHPTWDIYRTEWSVIDIALRIVGQLDAIFIDREKGTLHLVDYKHFKTDPRTVYTEDDTGLPERGCHPLTWHHEKSVLRETEVQLNMYAFVLERPANQYNIKIEDMRVWWFNPRVGHEMEYEELPIPRIDAAAYYAALVDTAPVPPPPPRVVEEEPMPPGALHPSIPRPVPGPTTIGHVTKEVVEVDADAVWTGKKWASKTGEWALPESIFKDPKPAFKRDKTPKELRDYERHLLKHPALCHALPTLRGKHLVCWCPDGKCGCHCQVLRDYANALDADSA
jgi:hypothetical protein